MAIYDTILGTIGNTPCIKLQKLAPAGVNVYVKMEAFNPGGSVKDRMALAVIEQAEASGELKPGQTVIEATSGNTGIGLAVVCAQKGYPLVIVMAENFSVERRKLLRFLGAKVVLTPAADKGTGMLRKAEELAALHGYFLPRQFANEANADIHSRTTAQEILRDFADRPLDYWVSGFGTGGTLRGVSRVLKEANPATKIMVAEPDNSPVLRSQLPQPKDSAGNINESHPHFRPHLMQGWAPDFISPLTEAAVNSGCIDEIVPVAGDRSLTLARELAQKEGIFVGISSGATLAAALTIAERSAPGTNILCMLPDTGERYLSTPLFETIGESMNDDEIALSQSTPSCRFDNSVATPTPVAPAASATNVCSVKPAVAELNNEPVNVDPATQSFVDNLIKYEPVVLFALEWCEFCWAVRKLFKAMGVKYYSVDLDSISYQTNNRGGKVRQVLKEKLNTPTIPQIFIGGKHMGGASDVFAAFQSGQLKAELTAHAIPHKQCLDVDAQSLLPNWLQPRKTA